MFLKAFRDFRILYRNRLLGGKFLQYPDVAKRFEMPHTSLGITTYSVNSGCKLSRDRSINDRDSSKQQTNIITNFNRFDLHLLIRLIIYK